MKKLGGIVARGFFESCLWDLNANPGDVTAPCQVLNAVAQRCEDEGFDYWTPKECAVLGKRNFLISFVFLNEF